MMNALFQGSRLAALAFLAPTTGLAWQADNRLEVTPLPERAAFEVIGRPGSAGPDYWCAAGDYALRVMGAPGNARIYIVRGRSTPETSERLSSVQFSLNEPAGNTQPNPPFLSMKRVGDNLSVSFARNYCVDKKNLEF